MRNQNQGGNRTRPIGNNIRNKVDENSNHDTNTQNQRQRFQGKCNYCDKHGHKEQNCFEKEERLYGWVSSMTNQQHSTPAVNNLSVDYKMEEYDFIMTQLCGFHEDEDKIENENYIEMGLNQVNNINNNFEIFFDPNM